MARVVILPKFDMMMESGKIVRWLRQEGEQVRQGDPLVEVETDKVNMEVESPATGILAGIRGAPGDVIPVTEVIAYILEPGEPLPEDDVRRAMAPRAGEPQ